MRLDRACGLLSLCMMLACGGQTPPPQTAQAGDQTPPPPTAATPSDPFALPNDRVAESPPSLPKAPPDLQAWRRWRNQKQLPAPSASCVSKRPSKPAATCTDAESSMAALESALTQSGAARDAALAGLMSCQLPAGLVPVLRAELLAPECADAVVDSFLDRPAPDTAPWLLHMMVGQSLGAKLARSVADQPKMRPPFDKAAVLSFLKDRLAPWANVHAGIVQELAAQGAQLAGPGKLVVAIEAGRADLRFVEAARQVPIAEEFQADAELRQVYESSLDQALEPRKHRGRDAALVGVRGFADLGLLASDPRLASARGLLTTLYGGRRVDALDALLIPSGAERAEDAAWPQIAKLAPTYALTALPGGDALLPSAEVLARAWPPELRTKLGEERHPRVAAARRSLRLAATHFRRASADAAIDALGPLTRDPEVEFLLALALALHQGPKDVVTMMMASTPAALGYRELGALEVVADGSGPFAAAASFNLALLREIAPPDGAGADYFTAIAARYRTAQRRFGALPEAKLAEERANHAQAIADAMR